MSERFDVVVAGAGTAGAYASYLLAKAGFKVALLESKSGGEIGVKTCGDGLGLHHVERNVPPHHAEPPRCFRTGSKAWS
jgi:2,3-di-O-geranylgeranylglyceryl phosphate reductase (EC 1.3.99.-)